MFTNQRKKKLLYFGNFVPCLLYSLVCYIRKNRSEKSTLFIYYWWQHALKRAALNFLKTFFVYIYKWGASSSSVVVRVVSDVVLRACVNFVYRHALLGEDFGCFSSFPHFSAFWACKKKKSPSVLHNVLPVSGGVCFTYTFSISCIRLLKFKWFNLRILIYIILFELRQSGRALHMYKGVYCLLRICPYVFDMSLMDF